MTSRDETNGSNTGQAVSPAEVSLAEAYEAAHHSAVLVDRSDMGLLKFTGETRLDLINRMSTQNVIDLSPGEGAASILTTDIGRIIDRLILFVDEEAVYCLTGDNNGENIANYLRRFVFFMDDFQVEDLSSETAILAIYGRQAREKLVSLFGNALNLSLHHWIRLNLDGIAVSLHRTDPITGDGYFIMSQAKESQALRDRLVASGIVPISEQAFDYLRIESGLPRYGHEISLDYIPLEANLWDDVSFNKGCYTGQEIIARMESRGRLAKKLVRLKAAAKVEAGQELMVGGKSAGTITSAGEGPQGILALGFVKTAILPGDPKSEDAAIVTANGVAVELLS